VEQELASNYVLRGFLLPTDPSWYDQWPWYNIGQSGGTVGDDLNVVPVWIQGVSGQNTAALVIDNGIQLNHPDLYNNIVSLCRISRQFHV
jgi:subtilisin family serine protease